MEADMTATKTNQSQLYSAATECTERHLRQNAPTTNPLMQRLRECPGATEAFDRLVQSGCERDTLVQRIRITCLPGKHQRDWYRLGGFSPDKLRRLPKQLEDAAKEIETLSKAIVSDGVYGAAVSFLSHHPVLARLGPDWFPGPLKNLPDMLRYYGAAIAHIQFAVQRFAHRGAKRGRARLSPSELIYYVYLATRKPHYEDVATVLGAACPKRFSNTDAGTLQRNFGRSEYGRKIKQLKASTSRKTNIPRGFTETQ